MIYKKVFKKISGKWYPESLITGKTTTNDIAKEIERASAMTAGDVMSVLRSLGAVMGSFMAQGNSVKLDGVGTFYFRGNAKKNGVDTPEEVNANLFNGVKIRFIPETSYPGGTTRSGTPPYRKLTDVRVQWVELSSISTADGIKESDESGSENGSEGGSGESGNPGGTPGGME